MQNIDIPMSDRKISQLISSDSETASALHAEFVAKDELSANGGVKGDTGLSAYQIAQANGFVGTETQWLASLDGAPGTNGTDGQDGLSAYQIAVSEGYSGTETQWLASLKGDPGTNGASLPSSLTAATDSVASITVNDDGTPTANWPNRWEWRFKPQGSSTSNLVQWVNEYGELRITPAKPSTVAWRLYTKIAPTDPTRTYGNIAELQDDRTSKNNLWTLRNTGGMYVKGQTDFDSDVAVNGKVTATNIGAKITTSATAPLNPSEGDIWADIS
jgi:hypothetical protein